MSYMDVRGPEILCVTSVYQWASFTFFWCRYNLDSRTQAARAESHGKKDPGSSGRNKNN